MEEIVPLRLDSKGNKLPDYNDLVALIDADTLLFASCLAHEEPVPIFSEDFYSPAEWDTIVNDPTYDAEEGVIINVDIEIVYNEILDKIDYILEQTGCREWEAHLTKGRKSFRYTQVDPDYKQHRKDSRPPVGLKELKDLFVERNPEKAFIWTEWEADDIVVAKKKADLDKYLLVALDKDVLYTLPGKHFNYYSSANYNIDMKFVEVDRLTSIQHHYIQTLTGDTSDGIVGIKGIGKAKAKKILGDEEDESKLWTLVVNTYKSKGRTEKEALTNMRLVQMHQLVPKEDTWEVILWEPKGE